MSLLHFISAFINQEEAITPPIVNNEQIIDGDLLELDDLPISFNAIYEPQIIYHKGKTIIATQKSNISSDGNPLVFEFDSGLNYEFGEIADVTDPINYHNTATIYVDASDFYYCMYPRHGQAPIIYRSTFAANVKTWKFHTIIGSGDNINYPAILQNHLGSPYLIARFNVDQILRYSGSPDFLSWSNRFTITELAQSEPNSTNFRHYPLYVADGLYNNYNYFCISKRITITGDTITYMRLWPLRTQDFDTFQNINGTWQKQVSVEGEITEAELNANALAYVDSLPSQENTFINLKMNHFNGFLYYYRGMGTSQYIGNWNGTSWVEKDISTLLGNKRLAEFIFMSNGDIELFIRDGDVSPLPIDRYVTTDFFDTMTFVENIFSEPEGSNKCKVPFNYASIPSGTPTLLACSGVKDQVQAPVTNPRFNDLQVKRIIT